MRQYLEAKRQYRDAIVFFRMGDFYEMFYEDALVAARALDLTLTSRSKDAEGGSIPMCGVPYHAAETYLTRLVKKGFRVAICEQVEDPRKAMGLVRREVVRVVSPGTFTEGGYLDAREPAFLMAVAPVGWFAEGEEPLSAGRSRSPQTAPDSAAVGVALLDLSTGEFMAAEYPGRDGLQALRTNSPSSGLARSSCRPTRPWNGCCRRRREERRASRPWTLGRSTPTAPDGRCWRSFARTRSKDSASKPIQRQSGLPGRWFII